MTTALINDQDSLVFPLCDLCPQQSHYLAKFSSGELFFCRHHFNKFEDSLIEKSVEIIENEKSLRELIKKN
jgi:hypothetical protein